MVKRNTVHFLPGNLYLGRDVALSWVSIYPKNYSQLLSQEGFLLKSCLLQISFHRPLYASEWIIGGVQLQVLSGWLCCSHGASQTETVYKGCQFSVATYQSAFSYISLASLIVRETVLPSKEAFPFLNQHWLTRAVCSNKVSVSPLSKAKPLLCALLVHVDSTVEEELYTFFFYPSLFKLARILI